MDSILIPGYVHGILKSLSLSCKYGCKLAGRELCIRCKWDYDTSKEPHVEAMENKNDAPHLFTAVITSGR